MEIALSSANRTKLNLMAESGDKKAKQLLAAIENPTRFFATTQLYITFIALFVGAYAASVFAEPMTDAVVGLGVAISESAVYMIVFVVVTILVTFFTLIFGELVPKRLALLNSISYARAMIGVLHILSIIVLPFVKFLAFSANLILRLFGVKGEDSDAVVSREEISMMVKSGSDGDSISETEQEILSNVLELDAKTVEDACIHRIDVVALPVETAFDEIVDVFVEQQYSRIPLFEENIDHVVGILHMKDVMKFMAKNDNYSSFDVKKYMREPFFVPAFKKTDELLSEMRKEGVYIAVVVDEYGGMVGIVTMEDLVEEIVGSISDEYDTDEISEFEQLADGSYKLQGAMDFKKVQELFDAELPTDEFETLSGFVIGQLRRIPSDDEQPEVTFGNLVFMVQHVEENRVSEVLVRVVPKAEANSEPEADADS
jgi:putative hemolysin